MKTRLPLLGTIALLATCTCLSQNPGDLVISEYMANSQDVPNDQGEYIELHNPTTNTVSIEGCVIQDASGLSVTVDQAIWLQPGGFAVLGRDAVPAADFYFPAAPPPFNLNNMGGDQITVTCGGVPVAYTTYTASQQAGQAMVLAGNHLHQNGHTLEAHYMPETYEFQYNGTSTTDFGSPGFAGDMFVLPVSLTHFAARNSRAGVLLEWATATEYNNSHFTVEHSTDGVHFSVLEKVWGQGDSDQEQWYHYTHDHPSAGENYYRLAQYDYDGTRDYSEVRSAVHEVTGETWKVYPTLATDEAIIAWPTPIAEDCSLALYGPNGQQVLTNRALAGCSQLRMKIAPLPSGQYWLRASAEQWKPLTIIKP